MMGFFNRPGSIRRRLILQLLAGAVVMSLVVFVIMRGYARDLAAQSQDNILAASVTAILDSAAVRNGALSLDIPYSAFSMLGNVSDDRVFYAVTRQGAFVTGYENLPVPVNPIPGETRFDTANFDGAEIRLATSARRLSIDGAPQVVAVSVAQTRDGLRQTLAGISRNMVQFGLGFFVLAAGLGILTARSTTGPLRDLAQSVSRRGPEDLRPVNAPVPSEMTALVSALNGFMQRLAGSLSRSEDLIAEAAHRVRTPLATVRTQAEITLRRVEKPENRQAVREMIRAIDESGRAAGQLLDHAMVSFRSEHLDQAEVDLNRLVSDAVARLTPMAELRDIALERAPTEDAPVVRGDAILLQSAVLNLIDNALKYAPRESTVHLSVTQRGAEGVISVKDAGAGFPEAMLGQLRDRFVRGTNTAGVVGSGLGLTIADEVARAHGGHLGLSNREERSGACAQLVLPLL